MWPAASPAPAASKGQLGDHSEGQTPTASPAGPRLLTLSFFEERNLPKRAQGSSFGAANWPNSA